MRKQILFLMSVVLVFALNTSVCAREVPDCNAGGSILVEVHTGEAASDSGSLTFYHVAQIRQENGNDRYVLTEEFAPSGVSLANPSAPELAGQLMTFIRANEIAGATLPIVDGAVRFQVPEGELGLYLVAQLEACDGYEPLNPFVIGVPAVRDGQYLYDVNAAPKMGELLPQEPTEEETTVPPETPMEPTLPQTGQLNWPVPVLTVSGMVLFAMGWALSRGSREKK